ncbi:MAG: Ig family protein [Acidobacteria bacterium]|nr:Ig family protein [Acidobacteriota bacterium]
MTRFRPYFLPIFFALLALVVAVAVVARIRSYNEFVARGGKSPEEVRAASAAGDPVRRAANGTYAQLDANAQATTGRSDPGVIVETNGATSTVAGSSARAQRFHELLAAPLQPGSAPNGAPAPAGVPPAPPPVAPKTEPQSAFGRLVAPIVNAIRGTGSSSGSMKPVTAAQTQTKEPQPQPARETDSPKSNEPADKTSDSAAPQLLSAEFSPPQVQDGQETLLIITAMDDLSGVRNISGSVTSPTGKALQGFAAQREGESNRYIGRIQIPRDAEEGLWRINFLSLSDNASNTMNLTYTQSPILQHAVLRVQSSRPDSTPPTVKTVWLERRAMTAGEKNTVYAQVIDDKSGVQLVTGVLLSPSGLARLGFGCHLTENDVWACEVSTPKKIDCGDWKLEQMQVQDKANNMGTERGTVVSAVQLSITSEGCDNTPPDMRAFVLSPESVSNEQASVIHVTAIVNDDNSGVASISGRASGPTAPGQQPPGIFFSLRPSGDNQTWTGDMVVPQLAAKGTWTVVSVQVLDEARNLKSYSHADPQLANAAFTVR